MCTQIDNISKRLYKVLDVVMIGIIASMLLVIGVQVLRYMGVI